MCPLFRVSTYLFVFQVERSQRAGDDYYQLAGTNIYQPPVSGLHLQLTAPLNIMFAFLDRAVSKSG